MNGDIVPLSELKAGERGRIVKVDGDPRFRRRIMEMGMVKGELVKMEREAPLGDPVEFEVKGYHLSLRKADASRILVEKVEAPS